MRFARNTAELFTTCDHAMLRKGERSMRRIWTNCPTVKRCTTTILSAAALLVGCDRGPDRPPPTAAAPRGGPQADLSGQINAVLDVLQLGSNLLAMGDPKAAAEEQIGRASCRKEWRARWSPSHEKKEDEK